MWLGLAILVSIHCLSPVSAVYKRWITTTDFDNPRNWDLGHLPCPNDHVIFPPSSPVVAINQDWTLSNIVLANDGIIVLADNLIIVFNDHPSASRNCETPEDITYNFTTPAHWLDPVNWCLPMHDFDAVCFESILQMHTETVPCATDDVMFPGLIIPRHRSSFYISLDIGANLHLGTLKIGHWFYSTESFKQYMETDLGKKEFIQEQGSSPSGFNITTRTCTDPAGCYCGTNASPWKEKICGYVGTCPTAYCQTPFTPTGHCCSICGARMELAINTTIYSVFHIREMINRDYIQNKNKNYGNVLFDISRLANGNSQVTLTDDNQGASSTNLAVEVRQVIQQDMGAEKRYGVLSISNYQVSGTPQSTPSTTTPTTTTPTTTSITTPTTTSTTTTRITTPTTTNPIPSTTYTKKTQPIPTTTSTKSTIQPTGSAPPGTDKSVSPPAGSTDAGAASTIKSPEPHTGDNSGSIIGGVIVGVCALVVCSLCVVCFLSNRRKQPSVDPISISMRFDDKGGDVNGGTVAFARGMDNPLYGSGDLNAENSVQLTTLSSSGTAAANGTSEGTAASNGKPKEKATSNGKSSSKKAVKKKKSSGFDNPLYFDTKTETVGTVDPGSNENITITNPIFDEECQPELLQFEDNFM